MSPDLTMCCSNVAKDCPLAGRCYRATATPGELGQSYFAPSRNWQECPYFIPVTQKEKEKE
jgi:hypothetical protein